MMTGTNCWIDVTEDMNKIVRVWHDRDFTGNKGRRRGRTVTCIWDGNLRHVGIAECSKKDQFEKKMGREISMGRAVSTSSNISCAVSEWAFTFDVEMPKLPHYVQLAKLPDHLYLDRREKDKESRCVKREGRGGCPSCSGCKE